MPNLFGKNKVQKPARNATHNVAGGGNKIFNILFIFVLIFISFFCLNLKTTFAATFKLIGSGNWSDGAIWDQGGVNIPTATDDVVLDNAYNVTVDTTTAVAKTLDMTGSAGILTITNAMKLSVSGSVTLASGKFTAGGTTANLTMLSTGTLTTAGNTMGAMTFSGASQIFTLGDSLLATGTFVLSAGTFNAGTYNITANNFSITAGTLNMGSGLWKTTNITTISTWVNNSGTVVNCNTSTLELSGNSTSITRSLGAFSGSIFYNLNISGTTTAPAQWNLSNNITVNGTFTIAGPNRIKVGIGKIITLGPSANLVANGTAGSLIEWNVISGTTPWTLSKASGNVNVSYLNLIYSTASGGANFYASHSTDGGNNSGWVFANAPDAPTGLTGIHGDAQASLSWTAGADNGAPITDYVVEYKLSSNPTWSIFSDGVSVLTSATVTGLTNGLSYDFRVSAVNGVGQGTASATTTIFIGPVKYARGVGGNWSADATWSTTSGGVANTVAPTATDYVIFDANSGNVTVDTTTAVAKNLNMTGSAGTLTITNAMKLSVSGSVTLASGKFTAGGDTAELAMLGTGTLITTGNTMGGLTFNGSGQTFTLGDAVTTRSGSQLTYYSGTLITGAFTHNWGRFRTETTVAKTFDITNSTINILYDTWNITSATNFTLISTNSTIVFLSTGQMSGAGLIYNNVSFNNIYNNILAGANTFHNLSFDGSAKTSSTMALTLYANQTIDSTGTLTLKGGTDNRYRLLVQSDTLGTRRTITLNSGATTSMQRVDFRDIGFTDPIDLSGITGGAGDAGGNNNITFNPSRNLYWYTATTGTKLWSNTGGATNWYTDDAHTSPLTTGDSPLPQDNVFINGNSIGASGTTISLDVPRAGKDINWTGVTRTPTWSIANAWTIYGSLTLVSGMTLTHGSKILFLEGRGAQTFTSAGKTFYYIDFKAKNGTYTIQDDLTISTYLMLAVGTFNANNKNVTFSEVRDYNNVDTTDSTINMGSGTWTCTSANARFNNATSTLNAGTSTLEFTGNFSSGSRLLDMSAGGKTFYNLKFTGIASATAYFWIDNGFTFNGTFTIVAPNIIRVQSARTITMGPSSNILATGSAGNLIDIDTATGTGTWTISRPSGTQNFLLGWLNLNRSVATQANTFFASNTTNTGTNTNWVFANVPDAPTGLTPTAGSGQVSLSWTAGADNGTAITDYIVEYKLTSEPTTWSIFSDGVSALTTATVTGLTNGLSYDFRVSAVNAIGQGSASATATSTSINPLDRYWVGGTGNWSDTAHWSNTSNGAGGQAAPTSLNNVYFDANSFSAPGTVTVDATANTLDMDWTGLDQAVTFANITYNLNVYGSLTLPASNLTTSFSGTGYLRFKATTTGKTITSGGVTRAWNGVFFEGVGGGWTNIDDWNLGATGIAPYDGTWNTNGKTISFGSLNQSNVTTTALTINLGSSIINCTYWGLYTTNNKVILNSGTSTININGSTLRGNSFTYYDVNFIYNGAVTVLDSQFTFHNLTVTGGSGVSNSISFSASQIVNNLFSVTGNNATNYRILISSNTLGTPRTITVNGSTNITNADFRDITFAGSGIPDFSSSEIGNAGGNSGITFRPGENRYYHVGTGNFHDAKWYSQTNGGGVAKGMPLPQDTAVFDASSFDGRSILTIANARIGSIDMSAVDDAVKLQAPGVSVQWYGSVSLGNNISPDQEFGLPFNLYGVGNRTVNFYGKSIMLTNVYRGSYTLLSNVNIVGNVFSFNIYSGAIFDINDFNVTALACNITTGGTLYLGNGILTLTDRAGTFSSFMNYGTVYQEQSTIKLSPTGGSANVTLSSVAATFNNVWFSGSGSGAFYVTNSSTFNNVKIDAGKIVKFTAGTTTNISSLTANGTVSNPITIGSVTNAVHTLRATTGTIIGNYLNLSYSTATGGASFYATNSTNGGNNTGWIFANAPDAPTAVSATGGNAQVSLSWSAPAWNGGTAITDYIIEYKLSSEPTTWSTFSDGVSTNTTGIVNGLLNGSSYDFRISAVNFVGQGVASSVVTATPITVPNAPTNAVAVRGNTTASVSFSAPVFDGGSPITNYTVTSSPGNFSGNGSASPIVVSGLTNGTAYTFTVTATNSAGTGPASSPSNSVTPATIPDAPTLPIAVAGNAQVSLSWTAPINNGGSDVTDYVIEYKLSSSGTWSTFADGVSGNTNGIVTGLTNALSYDFRISAVNDVGQGSASANTNATPVTVPDAPTAVSAIAGNAQATVSFTPPVFNGGSTINNYTVTSSPGNISNTGNASPILITGLTNGTQYTFTVTATNAVGESLPSSASTPVTPITVPDAPTTVTAVPGNTQATVSFTAPIFNGGTPITSYTATSSPGNFTGTGNASPIVVTGLTNGATYTFTVTATNVVGSSAPSSPSNNVTLYTEPGAPVNLASTVLGSSVGLSWSAPVSNGGSAVTDYVIEYQLTTGGVWAVFADGINVNTTATILGLSNGTSYDFRVKAVNIIGESLPSSSVSASPGEPAQVLIQSFSNLSVPNIGTNIRITNEGAIAYEYQYTWCVTDSDINLCGGGDDVFSSTAAKLINSGANFDTTLVSTVLVPGNYYFHIKVFYGSSSSRADQSFIVLATFPNAPTEPVALAGNAQATVSFTAPAFDGGSPVTLYNVVSNGGGITSTGNASPIVVTGLTNGLSYIFTVTATNIIGTSPPSISSNSVIPMTIPNAPTNILATAGNSQVALSWTAPINNGGSAITDYVVEYKLATESAWLVFSDGISTTTNATVVGLTNNLTYDFRVSAVNVVGQSLVNITNATLPSTTQSNGGGGGGGGILIINSQIPQTETQTQTETPAIVPIEIPNKEIKNVTKEIPIKENNKTKVENILNPINSDTQIDSPQIGSQEEVNNNLQQDEGQTAIPNIKISENQIRVTPTENPKTPILPEIKIDTKTKKIILYTTAIAGTAIVFGSGIMLFVRRRRNLNIEEFDGKEEGDEMSKIPEKKVRRKI